MIYFYRQYKEQLKKTFRLSLPYKDIYAKTKSEASEYSVDSGSPAVAPDVTREEFRKRYGRLRMTCSIGAIAILVCIYTAIYSFIASNSWDAIYSILLCVFNGILYTKFSFMAWMARSVYRNWGERDRPAVYYFGEYVHAICSDITEVLPKVLQE